MLSLLSHLNIVILFGEMGGGKNYHGTLLAKHTGANFLDGDTVAPPAMVEKVVNFQPLSREMVFDYIHNHLAKAIVEKANNSPAGLFVAQALYLNEDRLLLQETLENMGFIVDFVWIKPPFWQNLKQLLTRPKGWRWVIYWLMNKFFFQKPTHPVTDYNFFLSKGESCCL